MGQHHELDYVAKLLAHTEAGIRKLRALVGTRTGHHLQDAPLGNPFTFRWVTRTKNFTPSPNSASARDQNIQTQWVSEGKLPFNFLFSLSVSWFLEARGLGFAWKLTGMVSGLFQTTQMYATVHIINVDRFFQTRQSHRLFTCKVRNRMLPSKRTFTLWHLTVSLVFI